MTFMTLLIGWIPSLCLYEFAHTLFAYCWLEQTQMFCWR
jgi:hypothetical protein